MSMVLSAIPSPHDQLRSLQQELYTRNRELSEAASRIADLEAQLLQERAKSRQVERGAGQLRTVLTPLYRALGAIFGEVEAMGIGEAVPASKSSSEGSPVWDSWKAKLGGIAARIIDILMLHGELNQEQIRIHVGTPRKQTIYDAISKLNKAGIINKRDGRISLKEL